MEERKTIDRVSKCNVAVRSLRQCPGFQKALSLRAVVRYLLLLTSHSVLRAGACADAAIIRQSHEQRGAHTSYRNP